MSSRKDEQVPKSLFPTGGKPAHFKIRRLHNLCNSRQTAQVKIAFLNRSRKHNHSMYLCRIITKIDTRLAPREEYAERFGAFDNDVRNRQVWSEYGGTLFFTGDQEML